MEDKNKNEQIDAGALNIGDPQERQMPAESGKTSKEELEERKRKAKIFMFVNIGIFVFSLVLLAFFYYLIAKPKGNLVQKLTQTDMAAQTGEEASSSKDLAERKIDGVMVEADQADKDLYAVMIDNHADARPHAGIAKASLVFEAEVEGGMTRIMAVFSGGQEIPEIGPVRSARPYFIDWARELSALYAHVGGSPDALAKIQKDRINDINEFYNGKYFWRDKAKSAPHNVYTSSENLDKYAAEKQIVRNPLATWDFKDDAKDADRATSSVVEVDYRLAQDKVKWVYDKASNYYVRNVAGSEYKDKSGESVYAKNVIIMVAGARELDEKLRLEMDTIGKGKCVVCMDGKCQEGSWEKKYEADRTRFYKDDGQEISFDRGMTWIQVVRPDIKYSITN